MERRLPAEWEPQSGALVIWPHRDTDWRRRLDPVEDAFGALAAAITRHQPLMIACRSRRVRERALAKVAEMGSPRGNVSTILIETDDTWARDIAPITAVEDDEHVLIDCHFSGWGGKHAHGRDRAFARTFVDAAESIRARYDSADLVLEGGAIDTDGAGTLLVNRPTVLDEARNPGLDQASAETRLRQAFGADRVLWLDIPQLVGDDTDGHIDTLARFCARDTIVHAAPHGDDDPNVGTLNQLAAQLAKLRTRDGEPYRLVPIAGPAAITDREGAYCPASYANFLILNDAVLVPSFADANDVDAVEAIQPLFPDRLALPVPARTFVGQAGSLHCLTMQFPEGVFGAPARLSKRVKENAQVTVL
jgi:agmatine/peptidylarginine deiminase